MKTCSKCKQEKNLDEFKRGFVCKECRSAYMKAYREGRRKVDPNKQAYEDFMAWFETLSL